MSMSWVKICPVAQLTTSILNSKLDHQYIFGLFFFASLRKYKWKKRLIYFACSTVNIFGLKTDVQSKFFFMQSSLRQESVVSDNAQCLDKWVNSAAGPVWNPFFPRPLSLVWHACSIQITVLLSSMHQREIVDWICWNWAAKMVH